MKKIAIFTFVFCVLTEYSFAALPVVEVYYQQKEKTTEYIVEEDDDLDYKDDKYYFKLTEELNKKTAFTLNYINYRRKYLEAEDINNKSNEYKATLDYYFFKDKVKNLKLDVNTGYKDKEYNNKPLNDYDRFKLNSQLTYKVEGDYWIAFRGGLEKYDFNTADHKDKYIYFGKVNGKKYLYDKKLVLIGGVKLKNTEVNLKGTKTETELSTGADIKPDKKLLEKISLRAKRGERNTVEDEEYEVDEAINKDYEYTIISAKTVHPFTDTFKTSLRGELKDKTYEEVDYDYNTYLIGNTWKWKHYLSKGKERKRYINVSLDLMHADTEYDTKEDSSHNRNGAVLELAYKKWGIWSYTAELGANRYRYEKEEKDRNVYHAGIELRRRFIDNKLELRFKYTYRIKDYLDSDRRNKYQNSFLVGGIYKF